MTSHRKKIDHMIDIETASQLPTAAILSIGGCKFDIATGEIWDEFYVTIDPKTCKEAGLHFSKDTLDWWMNQNIEAWKALKVGQIPLVDALIKLRDWFEPGGNFAQWGIFDQPILSYAFHKVGLQCPWKYWCVSDCRTIANLYGKKIDRQSDGVHHNAKDDARVQAEWLIKLFNPDVEIFYGIRG